MYNIFFLEISGVIKYFIGAIRAHISKISKLAKKSRKTDIISFFPGFYEYFTFNDDQQKHFNLQNDEFRSYDKVEIFF